MRVILAYDMLRDPRDMAEVIHLAAGFGAEVQLIGNSIAERHWKVLRKLRSWRPELVERPREIRVRRYDDLTTWAGEARAGGFALAATTVENGDRPWSGSLGDQVAVLFGEETRGLSHEAIALCDRRWSMPMGPGGRFYTVGQATALVLGGMP